MDVETLSLPGVRAAIAREDRVAAIARLEPALPELSDEFDSLARLASAIAGTEAAWVVLVAPGRQLFAGSSGIALPKEVNLPDEHFVCAQVVARQQPLMVPDYRVDERFLDNPYVAGGGIRFYAGVPLVDPSGLVLGTVCAVDSSPRLEQDPAVLERLADVARQATSLLTLHRRRMEQAAQRDVLDAVAASRPLAKVLDRLARHVESLLGPDLLCSVLILDDDGVTLRDGAGPSLHPDYRAAIDGLRVGEGVGCCGTAVHRREPVVVADIDTDPKWECFRDLAARHDLRACASYPVLATDGSVLGTFALYRRRTGTPSQHDLQTLRGFRDLTRVAIERDRAQRELTRLATRDDVTGLLNRAAFLARAEEALGRPPAPGSVHAVLFCDVDRFKMVNDSLGHAAGDRYLLAVADALRDELRPTDLVSRFAGDAFVVLVPDVPPAAARTIAERVADCFALPVHLSGHDLRLSASVGVATTEASETYDLSVHLKDADLAMREAKKAGRARVRVCDERMRTKSAEHLDLVLALRDAVGTDEFHVHYQPEFDIATGELVGLEALLRWNRPEHGPVSPAEFIPVAEDTGIIVALGQQVLAAACRDLAEWRARYPAARRLTVWVNVSAHQLAEPEFIGRVTTSLATAGLPGAALGLEITESAVMADPDTARAALTAIRQLGVRVAIDDFGTGYSSLATLKTLPVDLVKIDRSFVSGLGRDVSDTRIIDAIVSMAHALQLSVVAEGVENDEQYAELLALGCDVAQGYLLGRPATAADLAPVLISGEHRSVPA